MTFSVGDKVNVDCELFKGPGEIVLIWKHPVISTPFAWIQIDRSPYEIQTLEVLLNHEITKAE